MDFHISKHTETETKELKNNESTQNLTVAVDYIEMLTLDANEFLRTKCVCQEDGDLTQTFCKNCFSNFKVISENSDFIKSNNEVPLGDMQTEIITSNDQIITKREHVQDNHKITGDGEKITCELTNLNKGLLNGGKIDDDVPIKEHNGEKQNKDDEITHKCHLTENNRAVISQNILNKSELSSNSPRNEMESDGGVEPKDKMEIVVSNIKEISCFNEEESQNEQDIKNCCDSAILKNKIKSNCPCHSKSKMDSLAETNTDRQDNGLLIDDKSSSLNLTNPLNINSISESSGLTAVETNLTQNLDLKNASHPTSVLQELLNPPSTGSNSSETAPSRHQQESAHGESCASHTSIEADGRWREQAPRCSREFTADVGANDALKRRISQDSTTANIFLTETRSNCNNSCLKFAKNASENAETRLSCDEDDVDPRAAKEQRQHLSWGFRNGRLVFAESKSDLGGSRIQQEQVVDSSKGSLNDITTQNTGKNHEKLCKHNLNEHSKETADKQQPDDQPFELFSVDRLNFVESTKDTCINKQAHLRSAQTQSPSNSDDLPLNELHQKSKIEQVSNDVEINECSTDGRHSKGLNKETCQDILYSKYINRRLEDSNSRLKYLEDKLKKAGIIDQSFESSENSDKKAELSSQNICLKCDKHRNDGILNNVIDLDDKNNSKLLDLKSNQEICDRVNNSNLKKNEVTPSLRLNVTCKCSSNQIIDDKRDESNELVKNLNNSNKKNRSTVDIDGNLIPTLTNFAKNHQYIVAHSANYTDDAEKNKLNDKVDQQSSSIPKYIEYSDFQKEHCPTDKASLDSNQNIVKKEEKEQDYVEGEDLIPEDSREFCQFDVNKFSGFSSFNANELSGYYDEFLEDSSSEESCDCDEEEHFIVIRRMRGDGCTMVNEPDRTKHNPDRANLKSLLKKPGRAKDKKANRVVFNENKNEFFDADYIILIREECDYDEDDDDGVCTCNQHEMVRLTCCEPNCNCQGYEGFEQTPQSPKFAPPIEFVDAVTLSPPEGYKDMEMMAASRGQQRGAVCRECSATHEEEVEEEGEGSQSDSEMDGQIKEQEEKEKTDQSQQTTPTTPPSSESPNNQNYILETITMTTVTQQQILRDAEESKKPLPSSQGSPISGILKGGRLWKQQSQQSVDTGILRSGEPNLVPSDSITSDDETSNKRSVRFIESEEKETRDSCDGAPESSPEEEISSPKNLNIESQIVSNSKQETYIGNSTSPDATEMTLTFKLGNHVLISNNSLKPNSAVRQLFPCTKTLPTVQGAGEEENSQQYLVTAESLRAFEEAKRSKLPQIIQSGETDETIKRAIERNTLRRSLIRYEPRSKKQPYKTDNSLVERIKQLTCDVDYNVNSEQNQQQSSLDSSDPSEDVLDNRSSPPGEEARQSPDVNTLGPSKSQDKSFSPSSSSSSSSMSLNQNYHQLRKLSGSGEQALIMDLKRIENVPDIQNNFRREVKVLPDIGGPHIHDPNDPPRAIANQPPDLSHCAISNKISSSSTSSESRRQFLAPLTACVTMGVAHNEDYYYHLSNNAFNQPGERQSVVSSGTEYSLDDIDEGLKTEDDEHKRIAPDVLAGTPSASESGDELAMFVQQDAGRIERIKKKYQPVEQSPKEHKTNDEDDEHDDYGFNKRPSVRGIKPRFSTTTEILQQIQNQLQPPAPPPSRVAWPYYSESGLTDNSKQKNANQNVPANYQYANVSEEAKTRGYPPQYRPTSLQDENLYQNCANQRCLSGEIYHRANVNAYSPVVRMGNEYYQSLPVNRVRNARPQSPPPMDMSKQYHQTMVYIPYNHIEGYQPIQYYHHTGSSDYISRVSSQNQINKRYVEPVYQSRVHHHVEDHHYSPSMLPPVPPKTLSRVPYPNGQPPPHMMGSRSESPLPGQFSTARSTQTPAPTMSTCGYYPSNPRYRPMVGPVWQGEGNYATKVNRHSFPMVGPRYPPADSISLTDSDSQHSGSLPNGYRQSDISGYVSKDSMPNSPTKPRFIERGVPEGAASVSPQDVSGVSQSSSSTMTSPTSPQNPPVPTNQKPLFYAMNV